MGHVTPAEFETIKSNAAKAGVSISDFVRSASLGMRIESRVDQQAIVDLLKLKAELAKHGGLFKLALQEHRTEIFSGFIHKYFQLETKLREKIEAL